jgi:hypothetical protein
MTNLRRNSLTLNFSQYEHHISFISFSPLDVMFSSIGNIQTITIMAVRKMESIGDILFIILLFPKSKANLMDK